MSDPSASAPASSSRGMDSFEPYSDRPTRAAGHAHSLSVEVVDRARVSRDEPSDNSTEMSLLSHDGQELDMEKDAGLEGRTQSRWNGFTQLLPERWRRKRWSEGIVSETSPKSKMGFFAIMRAIFNYPEPGIKLRGTAWLDALRGWAAFEVFIFHYADNWIDFSYVWGPAPDNHPTGWWLAPFIRTWFSGGNSAVCLFFAISGYVLTTRTLTLIRQKRHEDVLKTLSSAVMRRGIRLYMPVVVLTFLLMNLEFFGIFPHLVAVKPEETYIAEVGRWYTYFTYSWMPLRYPDRWAEMMNPFDGTISWTIPVEYYGSIVTYVALLMTSGITSFMVRSSLFALLIYMYAVKDEWYVVQFLIGTIYAEYQIVAAEKRAAREAAGTPDAPKWQQHLKTAMLVCTGIFGFYLFGLPVVRFYDNQGVRALVPRPGFDWFVSWPQWFNLYESRQIDRYTESVGADCILIAVGELRLLQRFFETRPMQYLGRISFGLYLCHIWVRAILNDPVSLFALGTAGLDTSVTVVDHGPSPRFFLAYVIRMAVLFPINCIAAGLFERCLDRPSVNLAKRFEKLCLYYGNDHGQKKEGYELDTGLRVARMQDDAAETQRSRVIHEYEPVPMASSAGPM